MNHILINSRSLEGTSKSNTRNTIQGAFCWHWANQIQYTNGIKTGNSKKHRFAQNQEKAQLNTVEQQDSATPLLTFSKSLLEMRETENCKQRWETKLGIKKLHCDNLLRVFSKNTAHESWRIPVSNLKTWADRWHT